MSATSTPSTDLLLALCCECGTTRTVSRRASGNGGNRSLRCDDCHKTTPHAAIGSAQIDWREMLNAERSEALRELQRLLHRLESMDDGSVGVAIGHTDNNAPLSVRRYEDVDEDELRYWVLVNEDQSIEDKRECLLKAARWILNDKFDGEVCTDNHDAEYRGLWDTRPLRRVSRGGS